MLSQQVMEYKLIRVLLFVCAGGVSPPLVCLLVPHHVKLIHTLSEMGRRGAWHPSLVFTLPQPSLDLLSA